MVHFKSTGNPAPWFYGSDLDWIISRDLSAVLSQASVTFSI